MTRTLDIAGTEMTVPDPDEITGLSGRFQAMGDALADAQDQLSALASARDWNQWTGPAASAFGQSIGQLPGQLGAAQESYHEVAAALSDYADQMRPVVATLSSLATQADDAVGNLTAIQAAQDQSVLLTMSGLSPALAGLGQQVTAARAVVEQIQAQARGQQSELKALASRCIARINQALPDNQKHAGFLGDLAGLGRGTLGALDDLTARPFTEVVHDAGKLKRDFSWVNIGRALGDVSDVLGVIALIPGADVVAVPLLLGVSAAAVTADLIARAKHEHGATYTEAGFAAVTGLLGGAGKLFDAAGAAEGLADGAAADASATDLLKAGVKHVVNWPDIKASLGDAKESAGDAAEWVRSVKTDGLTPANQKQLQAALTKVSDSFTGHATEFLHLGADPASTLSPAATVYQHLGFLTDHAGQLVTVEHDQLDDSTRSAESGSAS